MSRKESAQNPDRTMLKKLREQRQASVRAATEKMKRQEKRVRAVKSQLGKGAQTVPEIAAAIGAGTAETLWYVATLRKYGQIVEGEKSGAYFTYALRDGPDASETE